MAGPGHEGSHDGKKIGSGAGRDIADAVRRMAAKLQAKGGKEIYRQRKKIVEPVFWTTSKDGK